MQSSWSADRPTKKRRVCDEEAEPGTAKQQTFEHSTVCNDARAHFGNQYNSYYGPVQQGTTPFASLDGDVTKTGVKDALRFDGMDLRHASIKSAHGNTCRWFFDSPEYKRWRDDSELIEHHGFLWMRGKPGAGKSTIMKLAVRHAERTFTDELSVSFFFSAKGQILERSTEGMYRTLLYQLLTLCPPLEASFRQQAWNRQTWTVELLQECFSDAVQQLGTKRLTCYVDALDECEESDVRDMVEFFEDLGNTSVSATIQMRVFFASRHYPRITIKRCLHVILDALEGHQQDIEDYIQSNLKVSNPTLLKDLAHKIKGRASDVFLWVVLVVRLLNTESDRGHNHELHLQLDRIPDGVQSLFEEAILERGTDVKKYLVPTLLWTLLATRPLRPLELYHAVLSLDLHKTGATAVHHSPTTGEVERFILNASKGLIEVIPVPAESRIWFIHGTVAEYLWDSGMGRLDSSLCTNFVGLGNQILRMKCLDYMETALETLQLSDELYNCTCEQRLHRRKQALEMFPFLDYASEALFKHAEIAQYSGVSQASFLETLPRITVIKLNSLFTEKNDWNRFSSSAGKVYILTALHTTALLRLELLHERDNDDCQFRTDAPKGCGNDGGAALGSAEGFFGFALQAAAFYGYLDVVEMLLDHGADVNAHGGKFHSALQAAIAEDRHKENLDTVSLLLEHGADVNAEGGEYHTALQAAAAFDHLAPARLLLERGANVNAEGGQQCTALQLAAISYSGSQMLSLMLDYGADVNAQGWGFHTALRAACMFNILENAELLLKHGSDVNARGSEWPTALYEAAKDGHFEIVKLLLEYGADINAKGGKHGTVLQAARQGPKGNGCGDDRMIDFLIEQGALDGA